MTQWGFTTRWIVFVAVGEAAGFAVATSAAIAAIVLRLDDIARLGLVVLDGAPEGAALAIVINSR